MEFDRVRKIKRHIDIAPLVDVVFQLLIFFMLTANFIMQPGIKVTLPEAQHTSPQEENQIIVFIDQQNQLYVNREKTDISQLKQRLSDHLKQSGKRYIVLKADTETNLGLAVKVMDIAKDAGSEDVVISTQPAGENSPDSSAEEAHQP
jgi:biopolymer transport protein ExbD